MKFYRVSYSVNGGNSAGYSWHTNLRAALAAARDDFDQDPSEYDPRVSLLARIDEIRISLSKKGVLQALKSYASYPDNG